MSKHILSIFINQTSVSLKGFEFELLQRHRQGRKMRRPVFPLDGNPFKPVFVISPREIFAEMPGAAFLAHQSGPVSKLGGHDHTLRRMIASEVMEITGADAA